MLYSVPDVYNLAKENIVRLKSDANLWQKYLLKCSYFNRYTFIERVLITAFKPNATAVASFNAWSKNNIYIQQSTNGIPLIRIKNGKKVITYVYDVEDTTSTREAWKPRLPINNDELDNIIIKAAIKLCEKVYDNHPELSVDMFTEFVYSSLSTAVFGRCGIKTDIDIKSFEYLEQLDTKLFILLGEEISRASSNIIYSLYEKEREQLAKENADEVSDVNQQVPQQQAIDLVPKQSNNIIGNIPYRYIGNKTYRKLSEAIGMQVADELTKAGIKYSGMVNSDNTVTLTFSKDNLGKVTELINSAKNATTRKISFSKDEVEIAKQTNLVNFLSARGEQIKRVGNNEYTMLVHDSMRISDNKFYWNSRSVGGNPVDFCMIYYGLDFKTAVAELLKYNGYNVEISGSVTYIQPSANTASTPVQEKQDEHKPIPYALDNKTNRAYAYLTKTREINKDIVKKYIDEGLIAQDVHGNVVFKVFDKNGEISGSELSSTLTERRFKQTTERNGNGFTINPISPQNPSRAMFFESAIDTLSYYSLHQDTDILLVSMAGLKDIVVLNTLERYGIDYSNAVLAVDNDKWGIRFAEKMQSRYGIPSHFVNDDELFAGHQNENIKDWNDLLRVSEWGYRKPERPPRRYTVDDNGEAQRLWNGKISDRFNEQDYQQFVSDTNAAVNNTISEEENSAQFEYGSDESSNELPELVRLNLPDDTVTIEERNAYGYTYNGMLPISQETALTLFDNKSFTIYKLYEDGTEGEAETRDEILNFSGMFGIESVDWEKYITPLLENAAARAAEAGLPFSYRLRDASLNEDFDDINPYAYDGSMLPENAIEIANKSTKDKIIKGFREETDRHFKPLQGLSASEIESIIKEYIVEILKENEIDIEILDAVIYGSRSRGLENTNSDLDVVVEYKGNFKEDALFNILNDEDNKYYFSDIPVDINPISLDTGNSLENFLQMADKYLNAPHYEERSQQEHPDIQDNSDLIGKEILIDNRHYVIESINEIRGDVSMRDMTFANAVGFPINRVEKIDYIRSLLSKAQEEKQPEKTVSPVTAPSEPRHNYRITEDTLGVGGAKEKFRNNISAIKTLFAIESENRTATTDEQEILSKYVGWGGLAEAFDESKENWSSEFMELKELLSNKDYASARASTLNAHYTSPQIIKAMYKVLANMGFKNGKILEPAMGIGNFFGMLPKNMQGSKLYGVELDSISGRIAKQLYPNANIQIKGFEQTGFTSNTFDVAIGNVPFGNYRINDRDFKDNDLIHDYFFKKSLDKVRPGGIIAFITSKGTLDKQDSSVRKYLAERAELLGAIRLPNNAFKANAGTEVTSDIIFLQKREMPIQLTESNTPDWIYTDYDKNGIEVNAYFINNPDKVLGTMTEISGRFGSETACLPFSDISLSQLLDEAVKSIKGNISENYIENEVYENIPANINLESYRKYCYAVIGDDVFYREGDTMIRQELSKNKKERMVGMIEISNTLQKLIQAQLNDLPDSRIKEHQKILNRLYDDFTSKYGLLSAKNNKSLFCQDDTAALLLSLENTDDKGNLLSKADIFTKRTIKPYKPITSVDTASEALAVSISEKAGVDFAYMSSLCSKPVDEIINDLKGVIYKNPVTEQYETADEYLSGNVREKLRIAKAYAEQDNGYAENVSALEQVQPEDLKPEEISVQLGSTWVPVKYFEQFTYELLDTPKRCRSYNLQFNKSTDPFASSGYNANFDIIAVAYDEYTATYGISNKSSSIADKNNVKANQTYGTSRMNAYTIIENTLNGKPIRVMDYYEDKAGKKKAVLNEKETLLAQDKQNMIKQKFREWIFADAERTEDICRIYNEKFNSVRPREYDGSHITFGGINPEISLKKHQKDAIAHTLYGGNTLLAHTVGAGKTFEMIASAMESKRLGLCTKSLICVPKPIVGQTAKEFMQLYPNSNILVPNENDFSKANREKFCSRIATGNYDAIIISHTQLEKIPLSKEKQLNFIQGEIEEIVSALEALKAERGEKGFTIKQLEGTKKSLESRLNKLNNTNNKDSVITFEELGIDKLYVDEAHLFKNLYFNSKMGRNIAGINASSISQRATDLFMKCRYLDEKTGSKGVVFATGTPISNSMTELYTMQNYLQHDELVRRKLNHFDAWASCFGETQLSLELAPEGKGYQMKTRFSKFFNLPELMNMFKEIADIKTADVLNLPVPQAEFHTVTTEPSQYQKELVDGLAKRAEAIRNKAVNPEVDNMLNVTNDGRKLALDQRLLNDLLPDNPNSKVNACVDKVFEIWIETEPQRSTQMIFCDLSTPDKNKFNVYDDIKDKLIAKGVPENEIAFIHSYNTDEQKQKLFTNVRSGNIRILLGSTGKMGTGTNVQNKLIAAHHLDCPWRPSDLEQRNGRIIRQGNENPKVDIYNYITQGTFDAYLYQLVEQKQRFISQIMTSKSPARSAEDVDESVLSYAQIKALASGDPKIKEKMDLDIEVSRLHTVFAAYQEEQRTMQTNIAQTYPAQIRAFQERIEGYNKDIATAKLTEGSNEFAPMTLLGKTYTEKKEAGEALLEACKSGMTDIGFYRGFNMSVTLNQLTNELMLTLTKNMSYPIPLGNDVFGNITRIDNALNGIDKRLAMAEQQLENTYKQLANAKESLNIPFPQKEELEAKEKRLEELNKELTIDNDKPEETKPEKDVPDLTKRCAAVSLG